MKKPPLLIVVLFSLMLFGAGSADAFKLGSFDAGFNLSASARYDDNVYVTNDNEVDDFYFVISPGFYINNAQDRNNELKLTYNADIYRYIDTGSYNDVEDHFASLLVHLNKDGRVWFRFGDDFARRHESRLNLFLTTGDVTELYSNEAEAEVGVRVSDKLEFTVAYSNLFIDFTDAANAYRDRSENSGSLAVYYRMFPKTRLLLQGVYKNVYHSDDSSAITSTLNSDEVWAMAGVTWDITDKSTGMVKVGYEWKDMQHPLVKDFDTPIYIVGIEHDFTPKTSVSINGTRRAMETDDPNVPYFITNTAALNLNLHPVRKLLVGPFFRYEHDRYSGVTVVGGETGRRIENTYRCGIDLGYEINKWLDVKVGYEYSNRDSTLTTYDFSRNRVSLTINGTI